MKPHPRIRKTIKWGGAAVTVLLVVVWIGSAGKLLDTGIGGGWRVAVRRGGFYIIWWHPSRDLNNYTHDQRDFVFGTSDEGSFGSAWLPRRFSHYSWSGAKSPSAWLISLPGWMFICPLVLLTGTAWRLDTLARRRAKLNLCPKCGYDRTGLLKDAKCPECGAVPASV